MNISAGSWFAQVKHAVAGDSIFPLVRASAFRETGLANNWARRTLAASLRRAAM